MLNYAVGVASIMDDWYEPKKSVGKAGQMRDRARTRE